MTTCGRCTVRRYGNGLVGVLQFSLRTGVGLEKLWALLRDFDINTIASWHAYSARGRGAYLSGVEMDVWLDLAWNLPLRVLYFLGSPFIWMVSQFRDILGLLDALVFLYVALRITLDIKQRRFLTVDAYLSVALVVAGIIVLFALGTSNYGTAFRHRAKVFPWLLLLYLYGNEYGSFAAPVRSGVNAGDAPTSSPPSRSDLPRRSGMK